MKFISGNYALALIMATSCAMQQCSAENRTPLSHHALEKLDGVFVDEHVINDMIWLAQQLTMVQRDLEALGDEYTQQQFDAVRNKIHDRLEGFIHQARMVQHLIIDLIHEWSQNHRRPDSFLLQWSEVQENEIEMFYERVTTPQDARQFIIDLKSFFSDFCKSCPKAFAEFKKKHAKK